MAIAAGRGVQTFVSAEVVCDHYQGDRRVVGDGLQQNDNLVSDSGE